MNRLSKRIPNSDSLIIVLNEMYGINKHIETVISSFSDSCYDVVCPNFLDLNEPFDYPQQEAAYKYFMLNVGFEKAASQIKKLVAEARNKYKHIFLLGYSIGATVAWLCSDEKNIDGVIGYYGSRIRDYMAVIPKCPVLLIFPSHEKAFDVNTFVSSFKKVRTDVAIHLLDGEHGFADPFSQNYSESSFEKANKLVHNFLHKNIRAIH